MKKSIAIILILSIAFQVFGKLVVVGWFSINRQELTELFCINKQKPESHCDGKCYLNKKLKETDQETTKGSTVPVKVKSTTEEVWFCESENNMPFVALIRSILVVHVQPAYSFLAGHTIFQPPRA